MNPPHLHSPFVAIPLPRSTTTSKTVTRRRKRVSSAVGGCTKPPPLPTSTCSRYAPPPTLPWVVREDNFFHQISEIIYSRSTTTVTDRCGECLPGDFPCGVRSLPHQSLSCAESFAYFVWSRFADDRGSSSSRHPHVVSCARALTANGSASAQMVDRSRIPSLLFVQ